MNHHFKSEILCLICSNKTNLFQNHRAIFVEKGFHKKPNMWMREVLSGKSSISDLKQVNEIKCLPEIETDTIIYLPEIERFFYQDLTDKQFYNEHLPSLVNSLYYFLDEAELGSLSPYRFSLSDLFKKMLFKLVVVQILRLLYDDNSNMNHYSKLRKIKWKWQEIDICQELSKEIVVDINEHLTNMILDLIFEDEYKSNLVIKNSLVRDGCYLIIKHELLKYPFITRYFNDMTSKECVNRGQCIERLNGRLEEIECGIIYPSRLSYGDKQVLFFAPLSINNKESFVSSLYHAISDLLVFSRYITECCRFQETSPSCINDSNPLNKQILTNVYFDKSASKKTQKNNSYYYWSSEYHKLRKINIKQASITTKETEEITTSIITISKSGKEEIIFDTLDNIEKALYIYYVIKRQFVSDSMLIEDKDEIKKIYNNLNHSKNLKFEFKKNRFRPCRTHINQKIEAAIWQYIIIHENLNNMKEDEINRLKRKYFVPFEITKSKLSNTSGKEKYGYGVVLSAIIGNAYKKYISNILLWYNNLPDDEGES